MEETLFELIQKMDKSEKRNFKLYISKYESNKSSNLIILFDTLNGLKEYNEEDIKKSLAENISEKTFNHEKFRLKKMIVNSLVDLHFNRGTELTTGEIISKVELGIRLQMPIIAEEWVTKGYKLQKKNKDRFLLLALKYYEANLMVLEKKAHFGASIEKVIEAEKACRSFAKKLKYRKFTHQFSHWYIKYIRNKSAEGEQERLKLINNPIYNSKEAELEFNEKLDIFICRSFNYLYTEDSENFLKAIKSTIDLCKSEPEYIQSNPHVYQAQFSNRIFHLINLNQQELAAKELLEYRNIPKTYKLTQKKTILEIEQKYVLVKLHFNSHFEIYEDSLSFEEQILKLVSNNKKTKSTFYDSESPLFYLIEAHFSLKSYDKALFLIDLYLKTFPLAKGNETIIVLIKLYEFCTHFELGNLSNSSSSLKSLQYYLSKTKLQKENIQNIFEIIKEINKTKQLAKQTQERVKQLISNRPYNKNGLKTLLKWINEKFVLQTYGMWKK